MPAVSDIHAEANSDDPHVLHCMDLWSGNRSVENEALAPGLEIFVYSEPFRGEAAGGDVHYISLCAGGVVTRVILADVSGHGLAVAETSQMLRSLMRRHMNAKRQERLVESLNREFSELSQSGRFATALIATYLSHRNQFTLCNAGHPRPLWYRQATGNWAYVNEELLGSGAASNLPLGLDTETEYKQFAPHVGEGDLLVLYTDALLEASGENGRLLGEQGLLEIVSRLPVDETRRFGSRLLLELEAYRQGQPPEDDLTLLVLRFSAARRRIPGIGEKLSAYAKLLGLS